MKRIISGLVVIFGIAMIAIVTPYPKEIFCVSVGFCLFIGGLVELMID